jgi:microcompartment protein CcmK/EutM
MFIARVNGNIVATQKVQAMSGRKLLIVEPLQVDETTKKTKPTGRCLIAVDSIGAGTDDLVLVTQGSSARMTEITGDSPVDCVIIGIVDSINALGEQVYVKN